MFIVAMTLAVIAAMGIYALQIASAEVRTSGFVRQSAQTQYLAAYGIGTAAQALSGANAQIYNSLMMQNPDKNCFSLTGVGSGNALQRACHRAGSFELQGQMASTNTLVLASTSSSDDASRGSVGVGYPDFYVEVTDPNQRQPPTGFATNSSLCFTQFTVSAFGLTPNTVVAAASDTFATTEGAGFLSEGLQVARARVLSGPITCTGTN